MGGITVNAAANSAPVVVHEDHFLLAALIFLLPIGL